MMRIRRRLLGIDPSEATFARRGFHAVSQEAQTRLEQIGMTFLQGYHAALDADNSSALADRLEAIPPEWRGFAYEGAAMGLFLLDNLLLWKRSRFRRFLDGPAQAHAYMAHVGVGWALARLPWPIERSLNRLDPLWRWLAVDGYGFHSGYFHWPRYVRGQRAPRRLSGYACRVFDQGLGRSLWFVEGADVNRIAGTISTFPTARHADLWSGVGLACAYAGGVDRAAIQTLTNLAGAFRGHMAQGAAFAAQARRRAGNPAAHTDMACEVICGLSSAEAAEITQESLADLRHDLDEPAYEQWRARIRTLISERGRLGA